MYLKKHCFCLLSRLISFFDYHGWMDPILITTNSFCCCCQMLLYLHQLVSVLCVCLSGAVYSEFIRFLSTENHFLLLFLWV